MFCIYCGAPNREEEKFCAYCKESLGETEDQEGFLDQGCSMENPSLKKMDLLKAFFDFSFTQFVSLKIVKFLYGLSFLLGALISFFFVLIGFKISNLIGIITVFIMGPMIFFITIIFGRVLLETILIHSKISGGEESQKTKSGNLIQWNI